MSSVPLGSNGFTNTTTLPEVGQRIIVRRSDDGQTVHLHGLVTDVLPSEGRVVIEHPPGVARNLWFPEMRAGWREAVERDYM